eukprot:GSA25T00009009001.1
MKIGSADHVGGCDVAADMEVEGHNCDEDLVPRERAADPEYYGVLQHRKATTKDDAISGVEPETSQADLRVSSSHGGPQDIPASLRLVPMAFDGNHEP